MSEKQRFFEANESRDVPFSALCAQFGISRKTGYKWLERYREFGRSGLADQSRAPLRHPNETPEDVVAALLEVRRAHPTWGPRKIAAWLQRHEPDVRVPATSTIGAVLRRHGLTAPRRRGSGAVGRSNPALTTGDGVNDVWAIDFKGQFRLANGIVCWPLTVTDDRSRYIVQLQALTSSKFRQVYPVMLGTFRTFGLPRVIRSDNGSPFASRAPGGLSAFSVWLLRLGIRHERITPGRPTENSRHERMHRTLKAETVRPPARSIVDQQRRFAMFRKVFNDERPHESLDMGVPADAYRRADRSYPSRLARPNYGKDFVTKTVHPNGVASFRGRKVLCGFNLQGLDVGFREIDDDVWEVMFFDYLVGVADLRHQRTGQVNVR
jgi:transposase InsO family protein